jgi:cytochrome P450
MLNVPRYIGGNLIEGGADTTSAFLQTLVLALVNFPDVQARAQEELDSVIGDERSPEARRHREIAVHTSCYQGGWAPYRDNPQNI